MHPLRLSRDGRDSLLRLPVPAYYKPRNKKHACSEDDADSDTGRRTRAPETDPEDSDEERQ